MNTEQLEMMLIRDEKPASLDKSLWTVCQISRFGSVSILPRDSEWPERE